MYESNDKMVSHPSHYIRGGMEVIDVIEAFTSDLKGIEATDTGNIIKYICRWKEKGGIQDIEKVIWYATHLRDHLSKTEKDIEIRQNNQTEDYDDFMNYAPDYIPEMKNEEKSAGLFTEVNGLYRKLCDIGDVTEYTFTFTMDNSEDKKDEDE